ncbi:MAG: SHOCT domain-containing protein, partial [Deltaproteobacteria bacterium]|nr:SHOCT domain-containing protein [Deltaproteobacteria bacterium]
MQLNDEQNRGIFNGVFLGYFVLLLHVLLILGL